MPTVAAVLAIGSAAMIAAGVAVFFVESSGYSAPYGRYSRPGWGPMLPATWAWVAQESPSVVVPFLLISLRPSEHLEAMPWTAQLTATAFLAHYVHRAFVYPFASRGNNRTPAAVAALAFVFCLFNGFMQTMMWSHEWQTETSSWQWAAGMTLWALGLAINLESDYHLVALRREKGEGYHLPQAGLFKLVTSANYFGEILEWLGYAIACRHLVAFAFAAFTFCNLVPRALHHHDDYRLRFGNDALRHRKAVIPFVL